MSSWKTRRRPAVGARRPSVRVALEGGDCPTISRSSRHFIITPSEVSLTREEALFLEFVLSVAPPDPACAKISVLGLNSHACGAPLCWWSPLATLDMPVWGSRGGRCPLWRALGVLSTHLQGRLGGSYWCVSNHANAHPVYRCHIVLEARHRWRYNGPGPVPLMCVEEMA